MEAGQLWRQYIFAAVANIGITSSGYTMGWTSPIHLILTNATLTPLDHVVTTNEESWIGSLLGLGAIFGPFFAGFAASALGRKWGLISSCIPMYIGWMLILVSSDITMIYVGRFFMGISGGMIFTISPMYCAEIATDKSRGALGSFIQLFNVTGYLLVCSIGSFVPYNVTSYAGIILLTVFCIGMMLVPETPIYLLTQNNKEKATKCLAKIRGRSIKAVQSEIDKMDAEITISMVKAATLADVFKGPNFKAFYISGYLFFVQQFCGIQAVLFYLTGIFEASGASLDSSIASIIIGSVQVAASIMTSLIVNKFGRRDLLFISSVGTAIGLGLMGIYFLLAENEFPVASKLGFLPILALVLFIISYCTGIGPLPSVIMSELLPVEVKTIASPLAISFCRFLTFLATRFFGPVGKALGMSFSFFFFSLVCVSGFVFTMFLCQRRKERASRRYKKYLRKNPPDHWRRNKCT